MHSGEIPRCTDLSSCTVFGPAPGSGQSGYLPNVAVTALGMFNDTSGNKWLRASTYGRGVWQFPLVIVPDFYLSVSNTPMTEYAGQQPALFDGSAVALGGYNFQVTLNCIPGATAPPPTCSVAPGSLTPTAYPPGTVFHVTASGAVQDYSFLVQGTDPHNVVRTAPITLNVVDFNLTAPSPSSIKVGPDAISGPVNFQVTAAGSFIDTVNLSCVIPSQLAGASCNFQPSDGVNPLAGKPVAVVLTINTSTNQAAGTGTILINGSVANGYTKTQSLSVTVTQDYVLAISNPVLQANVNAFPVDFKGTLTSLNGYSSAVNLSCGAGATEAPPTCSAAPTPVTPSAAGAPFTVAVASNQCSPSNTPPHTPYRFNIVSQGTDSLKTSHNFPVSFTATSPSQDDYTLEISDSPQTAPVNRTATFHGTLMGTLCYNYAVKLSCGSGAPSSCVPSPATLTPTVSGVPFTVAVSGDVAATYNFEIAAVGTDPNATTHSFLASFTSTGGGSPPRFSFTITPSSSLQSLPAGQPAVFDLEVKPSSGTFPGNVALSNSNNCPPLSMCSLSATQVAKGSGATHVTFTIATTAPILGARNAARAPGLPIYALWLSLPRLVIVFGGLGWRRELKKGIAIAPLMVIVSLLWLQVACGGSLQGNGGGNGQAGTPAGTYTMTVSGNMPTLSQQNAEVELTVN